MSIKNNIIDSLINEDMMSLRKSNKENAKIFDDIMSENIKSIVNSLATDFTMSNTSKDCKFKKGCKPDIFSRVVKFDSRFVVMAKFFTHSIAFVFIRDGSRLGSVLTFDYASNGIVNVIQDTNSTEYKGIIKYFDKCNSYKDFLDFQYHYDKSVLAFKGYTVFDVMTDKYATNDKQAKEIIVGSLVEQINHYPYLVKFFSDSDIAKTVADSQITLGIDSSGRFCFNLSLSIEDFSVLDGINGKLDGEFASIFIDNFGKYDVTFTFRV